MKGKTRHVPLALIIPAISHLLPCQDLLLSRALTIIKYSGNWLASPWLFMSYYPPIPFISP